jgi:putative transposase
MSSRKIAFSEGEYYHLYSRGVDKRFIFNNDEDRDRFVRLLHLCNGSKPVDYRNTKKLPISGLDVGEKLVSIGAYCLMPNHFHILVKERSEGGIVKFMSKLLTAYSSYFNKKYERTGALFGSEFKSSHAGNDEYLRYLFAYIHLNPLKIVDPHWKERPTNQVILETFLNRYQYSSFLDYAGVDRDEGLILSKSDFPEYFSSSKDFINQTQEWLSTGPYQGEGLVKGDGL